MLHGLQDAGEHLLGLGAAGGAIAAADLAGNDGGTQGVFGAPVGGVDRVGVEEKGEDRRKFDGQMRGEMAGDATGARPFDQGIELILEMAAGHGETVTREGPPAIAIADVQRMLEYPLDVRREVKLAVIAHQQATTPEQMRETGLMQGRVEAAIGRPTVADERAGELRPQDRGGLFVASPRQNGVDGRVRGRERPEPLQPAADFPAGLIGGDHVAAPDLGAQRLVGGTGPIGRAMQGVHEPARGDVQTKSVTKQRADFGERQAQLCMQDGGERDRLRAELRGRRAEGIRRLQGMAPLHATPTRVAAANLDRECAHDRAHGGEIFLILPRRAEAAQRPSTMRAGGRQRGVMAFVHVRGNGAMRFAAIGAARPPARTARRPRPGAPRERGRLAVHFAPRVIELIFEAFDLLPQRVPFIAVAIPVPIRSLVLASQALDFALLPLQLRDQLFTRRRVPLGLHASVMPRSSTKYKQKLNEQRAADRRCSRWTR